MGKTRRYNEDEESKKHRTKMKKCRWCGNPFDPNNSEHKHLCSNECFHKEQAIQ